MCRQTIRPTALKIAFWNIAGLRAGRNEAETFVDEHNVDVLMICETHLRACDNTKIRNNILYRTDRQGAGGGGTAIYVRNNLAHYEADANTTNIEASTVVINMSSGPLRLTSVYKGPNKPLLHSELDLLLSANEPTILAGDLNSKHPSWNSRLTNASGNKLRAYADRHDIAVYGPEEPTFFHAAGYRPDVLDILVAKNTTMPIELGTVNAGSSDHNPVIAYINGEDETERTTTHRKICWPKFKDIVENNITCSPPLTTIHELQIAVVNVTDCIQNAMESASRTIDKLATKNKLPDEIKDLIRRKNQARRAWQRHADIAERANMNQLARQVKVALQEYRNERWATALEQLEIEEESPWRIARALRQKRKTVPPIHNPAGLVYSDEDKAEAFADRLELQNSQNSDLIDTAHVEHVERYNTRMLNKIDRSTPKHVTPVEVAQLIKKLSLRKAPGPDNILNTALRNLGRKGMAALTNIFNATLRLRHFPTQWRTASVIVLPKPRQNLSFPQSYRPISLLSSIGKLLERIILARLQPWLEDAAAIPNEQHGFRAQHSTAHQLMRVTKYITQGFNRRQATGAILLDVAKAFDKVWHDGIIYKMLQLNAPFWIVRIIQSFLQERTFKVKLGTAMSSLKQVEAGVPQGSVLSPTLYNIYTHDIPKTNNTLLAQYADDRAVLTRSSQVRFITGRLQEAADSLESWFRKWLIKVNATKSVSTLFSKRNLEPGNMSITLYDEEIPWKKTAKYLGVLLDSRLTWHANTTAVITKARKVSGSLYPMTNRRSKLSMPNKLLLYRAGRY